MSPKKPLNTKEITELLSKLKAETPDYPSELMAAKKAAFLKQAVNIKLDQGGQKTHVINALQICSSLIVLISEINA